MKKINIAIAITLMCILFFTNLYATTYTQSGISIDVPDEYIELKTTIENNSEKLKNIGIDIESLKDFYSQNDVLMDYITADLTKEILVTKLSNSSTNIIQNISSMNSDEYEKLKNTFKDSKINDDIQLINDDDYVNGDLKFIHLKLINDNIETNKMTYSNQYYTVVNGTAYTFSINSINREMNENELQNIISSVKINTDDVSVFESNGKYVLYTIIMTVCYAIGIGISLLIRNLHRKKQLSLSDNKEATPNKFSKLGGFQIVFIVLIAVSAIYTILSLFEAFVTCFDNTLIYNNIWKFTYAITLGIQSIVQLFIFVYIAITATKKEKSSCGNVIKGLVILSSSTFVLTLTRIIFAYVTFGLSPINSSYFIQEIFALIKIVVFALVWIIYFKKSDRVNIYYNYNMKSPNIDYIGK